MKKICLKFCLSILLGLCIAACAKPPAQSSPASKPQTVSLLSLHQGNLVIKKHPEAPNLIYVDARDAESHAPHLAKYLAKSLASSKFRIVDTPSQAGYILHVHILTDGSVNQEALKKAVQAGYGKTAKIQAGQARAMLVDALMVQRRVPSAKRPSRQKMKNISSRNALGSSQMRLAVLSQNQQTPADNFSQAIAKELALRISQ